MTSPAATYDHLCEFVRETAMLESIEALLGWDERTYLPESGGEYRAEQITYLSGRIHQRRTDPRLGEWLDELAESELMADQHSDAATTVRQLRRDFEKRKKLPLRLVEELARVSVLGQQVWVEARAANDFRRFEPTLKQTFDLKREQAEALGYEENIYDALLDDYEPSATTREVASVLAAVREELVPLVKAIGESHKQAPVELLKRKYPIAAQEAFGKEAAARIGFNFKRGRLDVTHHPFCSGMGPHDCRLTTRYDEHFFPSGFFSILHEAGHGIYEQGLRPDQYGLPPGMYLSLGIHESQSRLWENLVGRSRAFWDYFYSHAQIAFPQALGDVSASQFHFAINDVRPSLIRVEADEATYNLHIIVRFELEQSLLSGELATVDLPAAWNDKYEEYLGIRPPNDADGCLQDVHWSAGLVGYFPTYTLGNLYAAQLFAAADKELGGLSPRFSQGDFAGLLAWLRRQIHEKGQCFTAAELCERVTGRPLSHADLLRHLRGTFGDLYALK